MRKLSPVIENGLVCGWKCGACAWGFRVRTPRALGQYDELSREIVEKTFDLHRCDAWPRDSATPASPLRS